MRTTLVLTLVCALAAAAAQEPSAAGTWRVSGEAASGDTQGGGTWNRFAVAGTLVVVQEGDALKGSWTAANRVRLAFAGRIRGDGFEFRTDAREVVVVRDGTQATKRMRWTFRGSVGVNSLKGTMSLDIEGDEAAHPQPFTAERSK